MAKLDKRIARLEQNPSNASLDELTSILLSLGFQRRGGKGSHEVYKHPTMPHVKLTIPRQNPLHRPYVIMALRAIRELQELDENG